MHSSFVKNIKYILGLPTRTRKRYLYVITVCSRKKRRAIIYSFVVYSQGTRNDDDILPKNLRNAEIDP